MLKIGFTPAFMYPDPNRAVFGKKTLNYLEADMAKYFMGKGVMPILIPQLDDDQLAQFINELDGIVLQGGSDIDPTCYNETHINKERWPGDLPRDEYELRILKHAAPKKMPIFGICRGFQVLNVFFNGTLYQDLAEEIKTPTLHRDADLYDNVHHPVKLEKGGLLHQLYDQSEIVVNSIHHQGVKKLGDHLSIEATSPEDNLIEAFKLNDPNHWVYGVQWHPEFFHTIQDKLSNDDLLTSTFIQKVKEYKNANN